MANCPDCGANFAMVGRVHRCVKRVQPATADKSDLTGTIGGSDGACTSAAKSSALHGETGPDRPGRTSTYRYRDPEKRRQQMKLYMREYRKRA